MKQLHPMWLIEAGVSKNAWKYGMALACFNAPEMMQHTDRIKILALVLTWSESDVEEACVGLLDNHKSDISFKLYEAAQAFNESSGLSWAQRKVLIAKVFGWTEETVVETLTELVRFGFAEWYE